MSGQSGEPAGRLLRRHGLRPRKRLGQNFLRDRSVLAKILRAADLNPGDAVLEVGAGTGVLTSALVERAGFLVAVELDDALYDLLVAEFGNAENVELWHGNALDFDPCGSFSRPYKLVGNIPYYITGPILRHFLEARCPPSVLVLMVQWEVAKRIVAQPGDLSLLGVSVQFYADASVVTRVPAGAFTPRPKVDSAVIRLEPRAGEPDAVDRDAFFTVARAGFSMRRKQLANSLSQGLGLSRDQASALLEETGIPPSLRAEALSVGDWRRLAAAWQAEGGR